MSKKKGLSREIEVRGTRSGSLQFSFARICGEGASMEVHVRVPTGVAVMWLTPEDPPKGNPEADCTLFRVQGSFLFVLSEMEDGAGKGLGAFLESLGLRLNGRIPQPTERPVDTAFGISTPGQGSSEIPPYLLGRFETKKKNDLKV